MAVKRDVVKLSAEEPERLTALIDAGKRPARQLTRARILLKVDASNVGEGWSDSQIAAALDSASTRSLGPASNWRKKASRPSGAQAFASLGQKAHLRRCRRGQIDRFGLFRTTKGSKRWTLQLLEEQVVELKIVDRASDDTIGRTLKKPRPVRNS